MAWPTIKSELQKSNMDRGCQLSSAQQKRRKTASLPRSNGGTGKLRLLFSVLCWVAWPTAWERGALAPSRHRSCTNRADPARTFNSDSQGFLRLLRFQCSLFSWGRWRWISLETFQGHRNCGKTPLLFRRTGLNFENRYQQSWHALILARRSPDIRMKWTKKDCSQGRRNPGFASSHVPSISILLFYRLWLWRRRNVIMPAMARGALHTTKTLSTVEWMEELGANNVALMIILSLRYNRIIWLHNDIGHISPTNASCQLSNRDSSFIHNTQRIIANIRW